MAKTNPKKLIESLRTGGLAKVSAMIRSEPETARRPQAVGEAARLGWSEALELLLNHGADLNASWRNHRLLHSVIQEKPHSERPSDVAWMEAAWPAGELRTRREGSNRRYYKEENEPWLMNPNSFAWCWK